MGFSFKTACLVVLGLVVTLPVVAGPEDMRALRFLSLAITDQPPSAADAKALYNGETTLAELRSAMLASEAHKNKVKRFFNDLFGVGPDIFIQDSLHMNPTGYALWTEVVRPALMEGCQ